MIKRREESNDNDRFGEKKLNGTGKKKSKR